MADCVIMIKEVEEGNLRKSLIRFLLPLYGVVFLSFLLLKFLYPLSVYLIAGKMFFPERCPSQQT